MTGLGASCGACKFLRRRCTSECVFAPYFCYEEAAAHFAAVHRVFGASNVSKLLSRLPVIDRGEAAATMSYEALARMEDPIYGCVAQIFALQQQVASLQEEIETIENQMTNFGSCLANMNLNNNLQVSSHYNAMSTTQTDPQFSGNHDFYTQMNIQLPGVFGLEEQTVEIQPIYGINP
ncbi:LOB domain-containing protein 33-like [Actinidia eriantha]|uniref:LOB domain-containing protein 33-like n=1 Tax=Actinidia eriantha TaxID=165200 RepID=UPI002590F6D4|nr:LOB domain-containing protein 33-like [Actinidia eriantha]